MILIADDFESEIDLLTEVITELELGDFKSACDGKEAIQILESVAISVLITDYNMPYFNGAEVILRAMELGVKKIILRSSHSVSTLRENVSEYGINPFDIEIICKRDYDKASLKAYLKNYLQ
jgi:CheY-like chemotaxis protein